MLKRVYIVILLMSIFAFGTFAQPRNESGHCYRGFLDAGYTFGVGDYEFDRFEVSTTHGFQINPIIFIGGGVGVHFMSSYKTPNSSIPLDTRESSVEFPVFANLHLNLAKSMIAPFIDAKAGVFVTNNSGEYLNTSAGLRIACNQKQAINISFGYTREKLEFETFNKFIGHSISNYTRVARKRNAEGLSLKVGYEF